MNLFRAVSLWVFYREVLHLLVLHLLESFWDFRRHTLRGFQFLGASRRSFFGDPFVTFRCADSPGLPRWSFEVILAPVFSRQHWSFFGVSPRSSDGLRRASTRFISTQRKEHHRDFFGIFGGRNKGENLTFSGRICTEFY